MTTRADIAREMGVSRQTVSDHASRLGIPTRVGAGGYELSSKEAEILHASLKMGFGRAYGITCSICNEKGHSHKSCPNAVSKKCNLCHEVKPVSEYAVIKQKGRNGKRLSGTCKTCEKKRLENRYSDSQHRSEALIASASHRAVVTITSKDVMKMLEIQNGKCFYSGLPMTSEKGFYGFSLERINNSNRDYTKENVVLCCWGVNQMKRNMDLSHFLSVCKAIAANNA